MKSNKTRRAVPLDCNWDHTVSVFDIYFPAHVPTGVHRCFHMVVTQCLHHQLLPVHEGKLSRNDCWSLWHYGSKSLAKFYLHPDTVYLVKLVNFLWRQFSGLGDRECSIISFSEYLHISKWCTCCILCTYIFFKDASGFSTSPRNIFQNEFYTHPILWSYCSGSNWTTIFNCHPKLSVHSGTQLSQTQMVVLLVALNQGWEAWPHAH